MIRLLARLKRDACGAVAIEFALWAVLIFVILLSALDIGYYTIQRGRLAQAVSGASIGAFKQRSSVDYNALSTYIAAAAAPPAGRTVQVTIGCNGGTNNCNHILRVCACLSQSGAYIPTVVCGVSCGGGSTPNSQSGYYLNIRASYAYRPIFVPGSVLGNATLSQASTVRLQ